jgi:hypothetical protein
MTSTPDADARLIGAHDLALSALREITPASTIGPAAGYLPEEDGSVSLRFENRLPGYPGWYWIVTVARVDDAEPTVLEIELLPGDGALLAPEWVPWAERLADYRAHQVELAEQAAAAGAPVEEEGDESASEDELDEDDDLDDDELDDHVADILHAGDVDGVDIDELDTDADDDGSDDDESDDEDDDESEDSDDDFDEDSDDEDSDDEDSDDEE